MDSDNSNNTLTTPSREYYDDEIDLRDLILVLWNYRKLIVGIYLASVLIGAVISFAMTPIYQVQAKISLGNYNQEVSKPLMTPETAKEILLSRDFQEEAWGSGNNTGVLNITRVEKTNILQITLETSEPQQGVVLLNELIAQFEEKTEEQYEQSIESLNKDLRNTEGELQEINKRIKQTQNLLNNPNISDVQQSELLNTLSRFTEQKNKLSDKKSQTEKKIDSMESMQVLEKPKATSSPVRPNKKLNIVLAGALGLMAGVFAAFTVDYFRENPLSFNK